MRAIRDIQPGVNDLCEATPWNFITGFRVAVLEEGATPPEWWPCTGDDTERETNIQSLTETIYLVDYEKYLSGLLTKKKYDACTAGNWSDAVLDDGTDIFGSCGIEFEDWVTCSTALEPYLPVIDFD